MTDLQSFTLMMASAQVVETSVNTNNSPSQDYTTNPDNHSKHNKIYLIYFSDFLQEQESEGIEIIDDRIFLTENDPKRDDFGFATDIDTDISGMVNNSMSKPSVTFVDEHQYDTSSQAEPRKSSRRKRNKLAGSVSDSDNDSNYSENSQDEGSAKQFVPTHSKESGNTASKSDEDDDSKNDENRKFDGVFSDTDDSEESSEE